MEIEENKQPQQLNQEKTPENENQNNNLNFTENLKSIDVYQHLRRNILDPKINCKETLSEEIYYCITCKQSTCEQCSLAKHQNHKIYPKLYFYSYNDNFFDEVQSMLKESYKINDSKDSYILLIETQANELHNKIEDIKESKIKEINANFRKVIKCIKELENNTNEIKKQMETFYKNHNDFFNVVKNNDFDNSIFLLYYELNFLGSSKNFEMKKRMDKLKNDFLNYKDYFEIHKNKTIKLMEDFIGLEEPQINMDDLYWDVKFRIKTYNEHIEKIKQNIYDIMKHSGSINDLKELVNILDSKNKKGIQYIFNQDYFTKNQNNSNKDNTSDKDNTNKEIKQINKTIEAKRRDKNKKIFSISKRNILNGKQSPKNQGKTDRNDYFNTKVQSKKTFSPTGTHQKSYSKNKNFPGKSSSFINFQTMDASKAALRTLGINSSNDITLDDKIKKKFFTYSYIDLYNKLFTNQPRKSFDNNARIFADYNERNSILKEYIKPIPCSNEIIVYNPTIDRSKKIKLPLNKKTHGYDKFPAGCRHLNIENKVYICGGVDEINIPLSICLVYNSTTNTIQRIDDMNVPHAYHSMEFLDNYDCFLVVGGENNKAVELFDIFTNKWTRLPDLNIPRANINIYFNDFTSEIYALFGMLGNVSKKHINNSEIIEVLELNDISSGWCKVDYYKGSSFDIRNEIVTTLPFTRNKLLIYGGKNVRDGGKLFGLFLIDRMEVIKADKDIIEKIKFEQKKIKLLNNTVAKTHSGK
jgi:hypothetical protein